MKNRWMIIVLCCLFLMGCSGKKSEEIEEPVYLEQEADQAEQLFVSGAYAFYYTNSERNCLDKAETELDLSGMEMEQKLQKIHEVITNPENFISDEDAVSVIPEGVTVTYTLQKGSKEDVFKVQAALSSNYDGLKPNEKVILRTGISKALFFSGQIETVAFYQEGHSEEEPEAVLDVQDAMLIDQVNNEFYVDRETITLYFEDPTGTYLVEEKRQITMNMTDTLPEQVLEALLSGPMDEDKRSMIPDSTEISSVWTKKGICYVDLSTEFIDNYMGTTTEEKLTIYSIVNSLTRLPGISYVQILVDGAVRDTYQGNVSIAALLSQDLEIVMEE